MLAIAHVKHLADAIEFNDQIDGAVNFKRENVSVGILQWKLPVTNSIKSEWMDGLWL